MSKILKSVIEKLADIEHQRWASWQRYVHSKAVQVQSGVYLPDSQIERWSEQIRTDYKNLSEEDKQKTGIK